MSVPKANDRKVLVIGWDAADWRVIDPMLAEGKLPNLTAFLKDGVRGTNATLEPALSPMLWTSIATGKRPYKHGIHGFSEPTPNGQAIRPITNTNRTCKAIWNILHQCGKKSNVVAWWPSHPAEPINGVMVSNWYQQAKHLQQVEVDPSIGRPRAGHVGWTQEQWSMAPGTVHPQRLAKNLQEFRFHPAELTAEHISPFVPNFGQIDQAKDKRLESLAKTLSDTVSVHASATALIQLEPWDFMAVYYDGIDHFSHGFMKYHRTKQEWVTEKDFELYKDVVEGGYRFHDMMLGTLVALAGEDVTIILLSDHGFHPDHLRPGHIPAEPAGPAIEHRPYGIFCMKGPGVRKGEVIHGANVLDLCPTVLSLYGLPVGADMDGKPLTICLEHPPQIDVIPSWEDIAGECGMHDPDVTLDSVQSAEAIKQLVDLGYIDEPNEDTGTAVQETIRELHYNLARAYMDGGQPHEAIPLLERIWTQWPEEHRFGLRLIAARLTMRDLDQRAIDIKTLATNITEHAVKSIEALNALRDEATTHGIRIPTFEQGDNDKWRVIPNAPSKEDSNRDNLPEPPKKLLHQLRQLQSRIGPFDGMIGWLMLTQALYTGDHSTARSMLESINTPDNDLLGMSNHMGGCWLELRDWAQAVTCYRRALQRDSDDATSHLGLARALLEQGHATEALDSAMASTELEFSNPMGHYVVGQALIAVGDHASAKMALELCLQQAPGSTDARLLLANLFENHLGDVQSASAHRHAAKDIENRSKSTPPPISLDSMQATITSRHRSRVDLSTESSQLDASKVVTIVSGLPRSGTSMMMRMLDHGGIKPFTDGARNADDDNPKGYYEHELATKITKDASWIPRVRGMAVKIVAQLLAALPANEQYRIIFMDRDLREVIPSQRVMLDRLNKPGGALSDADLMKTLDAQVQQIERLIAQRSNMSCLFVNYGDAIADPPATAARVNQYLGGGLNESNMAAAVDGSMQRQRATSTEY